MRTTAMFSGRIPGKPQRTVLFFTCPCQSIWITLFYRVWQVLPTYLPKVNLTHITKQRQTEKFFSVSEWLKSRKSKEMRKMKKEILQNYLWTCYGHSNRDSGFVSYNVLSNLMVRLCLWFQFRISYFQN